MTVNGTHGFEREKKTYTDKTKSNPAARDDTLRSKDTKQSVCARNWRVFISFFASDPPHGPTVLSTFTSHAGCCVSSSASDLLLLRWRFLLLILLYFFFVGVLQQLASRGPVPNGTLNPRGLPLSPQTLQTSSRFSLHLHLHVLNPDCRENVTKHDWNGVQCNSTLFYFRKYLFCSFCWKFDYYIHVKVQGFGTFLWFKVL